MAAADKKKKDVKDDVADDENENEKDKTLLCFLIITNEKFTDKI